jgi:chaperonin GroES
MNARPTYNKIIVRLLEESDVTKSGIILPPTREKQQSVVGIVEAVGPGRITENGTLVPCCVKVGDKILMNRFVGFPVEIDGVKYASVGDVEAIVIFPPEEKKE